MHQRGTLVIFDVTNVGRLLHSDVFTETLQKLKKNLNISFAELASGSFSYGIRQDFSLFYHNFCVLSASLTASNSRRETEKLSLNSA